MSCAIASSREWLFFGLVATFCGLYSLFYPATYAIEDEASILSLAYGLAHGTIYVDQVRAAPVAGLPLGGHLISKASPFHAALLAPAFELDWRLAFLVTAVFFIAGAFALRDMLSRDRLSSDWCVLYFLIPGALFYSQTLMAAVPAAVMGLIGVSLLMRSTPRPLLAGLAFGLGVLFHPWMAPMAIVFVGVWWFEQGMILRDAAALVLGAVPSVILLALYNYLTTGSPFRDVYTIMGHQHLFGGQHFGQFLIFYLLSLGVFPLAGWAVLSPRWCGTRALPASSATLIVLASLYYYRDGLNVSSARLGNLAALAAGFVPGQRFLLPVSMVACLPAARFLRERFYRHSVWTNAAKAAAVLAFAVSFIALSVAHQNYLLAHAGVQRALRQVLPAEANIVASGEVLKEMAPIYSIYERVRESEGDPNDARAAYVVWLCRPGAHPPTPWVQGRRAKVFQVRSWVWNRDLWIVYPVKSD